MTPGTIEAIGGFISVCIVPVILLYLKNSGALNLKRLDNRTVSESLFRDELKKRDDAIYKIEQEMIVLTDKYRDQRERDLTEIQTWKDKYEEQVNALSKLQQDFESLKAKII